VPGKALALLLPGPMQGRMARGWVRLVAADFALVGVNWLLLGALLVPLHRMFPQVRLFVYAAGRPFSLLGIAVLHAALITLMGYAEGLYAGGVDLRRQARHLCKAVAWATTLLCLAYGLQGAPWAMCGLIGAAGWLHWGTLLSWRWQNERPRQGADDGVDLRKVMIVGAGGAGRRVAAYVKGHPEAGRTVYGMLDDQRPLGNGVIGRVCDLARLARTGFVD